MDLKLIKMKINSKIRRNSNINTVHKSAIITTVQKEEKGEFKANRANRNKNNIKGVFTKFSLGCLKLLKYDILPSFTTVHSFFLINIFLFRFFKGKFHN